LLETLLNVLVRLEPTALKAAIPAMETNVAIRPYSIAVAPSSLLRSLIKTANISVPFIRMRAKDKSSVFEKSLTTKPPPGLRPSGGWHTSGA
jgi:hypothetical protein